MDDKTGEAKAEIRIRDTGAGGLLGCWKAPVQGRQTGRMCKECTDDRKDKPVLGLEIIRAQEGRRRDVWEGGKILDPENGRNYTLRLTPIEGGKKLEVQIHRPLRPHANLDPHPVTPIPVAAWRGDAAPQQGTQTHVPIPSEKVAVLGAGVMGAQIAAHLVNVKVPVVLFDLPAKEGPKNGIVTKAVEGLKSSSPRPWRG